MRRWWRSGRPTCPRPRRIWRRCPARLRFSGSRRRPPPRSQAACCRWSRGDRRAEPGRARGVRSVARRDVVPRGHGGRAPVGGRFPRRAQAGRHRTAHIRSRLDQHHVGGSQRHRRAVRPTQPGGDAVRNYVLVPEALVVAGAVVLVLMGRAPRRSRRWAPLAATLLVAVALAVELWAGGTLATYLTGALMQDRFALFAKAAVLLAAGLPLAGPRLSCGGGPT